MPQLNAASTDSHRFAESAAPSTPASGFAAIYAKTDGKLYLKDDAGTETDLTASGASLPVADTTSLVEDPVDGTKEMRIDVEAVATGTVRVLTMPNADVTLPAVPVGTTDSQSLTNKTIDADNNTVSNIGSAEVKAELITGLTADATPDGAADYVMTHDNGVGLKKVLLNNLPAASNPFAILRDEKATTVDGGSSSAATWNARDLNTEVVDADSIVAIASNKFIPIAGDYLLTAFAAAGASALNETRLRLYNVTGAAVVNEGLGVRMATSIRAMSSLICNFTANGTDEYRVDHYTTDAQATNGLGFAVSDGSAEVYMEILLEKVG